jgi:hypothetical protein
MIGESNDHPPLWLVCGVSEPQANNTSKSEVYSTISQLNYRWG